MTAESRCCCCCAAVAAADVDAESRGVARLNVDSSCLSSKAKLNSLLRGDDVTGGCSKDDVTFLGVVGSAAAPACSFHSLGIPGRVAVAFGPFLLTVDVPCSLGNVF